MIPKFLKMTSLLLMLTLSVSTAQAYVEVDGLRYEINADSASVTVIHGSYYNLSGNVVIPEAITYNGKTYAVTAIGPSAFDTCTKITGFTIPKSVTSVGVAAFYCCYDLTSVNWNVKSLTGGFSRAPFKESTKITSFVFGDEVEEIPSLLCQNLTSLVSVNLPNSLKKIGQNAFTDCTSLESVVIPDAVTTIEACAFSGCTALTEITIGAGVASLSDWRVFLGCSSLTTVHWNAKMCQNYSMDRGPFNKNETITTFTFGDEVNSIPAFLCYQNKQLTDVTLGNGIKSIEESAFSGCPKIKEITLSEGLEKIGVSAFYECETLKSITIPSTLNTLATAAFASCSGLNSISVANGNTVYDSRENCNAVIETSTDKIILGCQNTIIPDAVKCIGAWAFYGCDGLKNVILPDLLETIEEAAFSYCEGLETAKLPQNLTTIGSSAFYVCSSLSEIIIPNSVTSVGHYAFAGCESLKSIQVGNGITELPFSMVLSCPNLETVILGENVKKITDYVFSYDTKIKSITCKRFRPATVDKDFENEVYSNATLYVPKGSLSLYYAAPIWMKFDNIEEIPDHLNGDVNGDGRINVSDVTSLVNMILGVIDKDDQLGDVNGDGKVNVSDISTLINIILGIE